ncbi:MAG: DegV domain-containing protein [Chloroflexi bacterium ADurb.Bin325]|nr:MAG: DegV domain-containing protein [Chloroflexi bacterium ADurb.Bin325]
MSLKIVTDSSTSVPAEQLARLGIIEVQASVNFGEESFLHSELSLADFYVRLAAAERPPTTSQPVPAAFLKAYEQAAAEGADEVIVVCVSGRLSGTLGSAVIAAEDAPLKVYPWDSEHVSLAGGWQAIAAGELAQAGWPTDAVLARLADIRQRTFLAFVPASLKHLVASGRVPKVRGAVGDLLSIKPIISAGNGLLEPTGQARGQRRALEALLDRAVDAVGDRPIRMAVAHANAAEQAGELAVAARRVLNVAEEFIYDVGPVLAALAGPGVLGLGAYALLEDEPHGLVGGRA